MDDLDFTKANILAVASGLNNPQQEIEEEPSFVGTIDKQVSVNMPVGIIAFIDAMVLRYEDNNSTRSSVIRDILRAAIYDIYNELQPEVKKQIEENAAQCLQNIVPENMKSIASRFSVFELCEVVEV